MIKAWVPVAKVKETVAQSEISTTMRYTHSARKTLGKPSAVSRKSSAIAEK
jgi:hypothetical protein